MIKTLFLPGATGNSSFWQPVANFTKRESTSFAWPEPPISQVNGVDDLVTMVLDQIDKPVNSVLQHP